MQSLAVWSKSEISKPKNRPICHISLSHTLTHSSLFSPPHWALLFFFFPTLRNKSTATFVHQLTLSSWRLGTLSLIRPTLSTSTPLPRTVIILNVAAVAASPLTDHFGTVYHQRNCTVLRRGTNVISGRKQVTWIRTLIATGTSHSRHHAQADLAELAAR